MEWRKHYLDMILVPLGLLMSFSYHIWLWHKTRREPFSTTIGINAHARRFWVPAMLKVYMILFMKTYDSLLPFMTLSLLL